MCCNVGDQEGEGEEEEEDKEEDEKDLVSLLIHKQAKVCSDALCPSHEQTLRLS